MGICLDTEQKNEELETTGGERSRGESAWAGRATPSGAALPMQNKSHVKFEPPNVPVIFVLGGPGSGKVTHCDTLMHERRGLVHINMMDLLQQYSIGNDMQDFGTLSSTTMTEVLMLEMKMAPTAKSYLVSGYPRSMRDVAEYSDKIQTINGVVLVSWRQRVLERQIEYGSRLGQVVLNLARMELNNFYKNVLPVADYFDQTNMLIAINGERNPDEVYKDIRAAVLQILGASEDQSTMNGVSGVGVGAGGIPGEIVGVEPAPAQDIREKREERSVPPVLPTMPVPAAMQVPAAMSLPAAVRSPAALPLPAAMPLPVAMSLPPAIRETGMERVASPQAELIRVRGEPTIPALLWVVGGPGSNKATLCQRAVAQRPGWTHYSLGQRLRILADAGGRPASDGALARTAISGGELAPKELVTKLVRGAMLEAGRMGAGLVLDGYPRDMEQMEQFQTEFGLSPRMLLLDCSKLQLGRGRRDDSVAAFRRRLEVFRELSLPMLKVLDQDHRLVIVDGDTDSTEVQAEFTRVLLDELEKAEALAAIPQQPSARKDNSSMQQFATAVTRMGGGFTNGHANGSVPNGNVQNGGVGNGFLGMGNNKVRPILNNVTRIPTVSQITHDNMRALYEQGSGEITMNTHI